MQAGTAIVLCTQEEFSKLKEEEDQANICVLKTPKFWQWCDKSRAIYSKRGRKQKQLTNVRAIMYESDYKFNDHCNTDSEKTDDCDLFVISFQEVY